MLPRSLGSWQPKGYSLFSPLSVLGSFGLIQLSLPPSQPLLPQLDPIAETLRKQIQFHVLSCSKLEAFSTGSVLPKELVTTAIPWLRLVGKEMGEDRITLWGFLFFVFFSSTHWVLCETVGDTGTVRNLWVGFLWSIWIDYRPYQWDSRWGKQEEKHDLVLGTLNILSYVILTFSFFLYGRTKVSVMR